MKTTAEEFFEMAQKTQASLPGLIGGMMNAASAADIQRMLGYVKTLEILATPDKDGNIPLLTLHSGATGVDGKPLAGADMTFPIVLALMGSQFAGTKLTYDNSMKLEESALNLVQGHQSGSSDTQAGGSFLGLTTFSEKIHAAFSVSEENKRTNSFENIAAVHLEMERVPAPEPVVMALEAFLDVVKVEAVVLKAQIEKNASDKLEAGQSGDVEPDAGDDKGDDKGEDAGDDKGDDAGDDKGG